MYFLFRNRYTLQTVWGAVTQILIKDTNHLTSKIDTRASIYCSQSIYPQPRPRVRPVSDRSLSTVVRYTGESNNAV